MLVSNRVVGVLLSAWMLMGPVGSVGLVALVGTGCQSRSLGRTDIDVPCWDLWECNPDRDCGPMIQCVNGACRSDLDPVLVQCPYGDCIVDDDCVVAQPYNCCGGCPQVARRGDLAAMTCHFEGGTTPGPFPPECPQDCMMCPICFPQPLGVHCDLGRCVATVAGCATGGATGLPPITTAALFTNPQQYDGGSYRIGGTVLPMDAGAGCDDNCPAFHCCDRSAVLDGLVRLEGSPCSMQLMFQSDDECADTFDSEGILPGGEYVVEGVLRWTPAERTPWVMEVLGLEVASPQPLGGAYEVFVTAVEADANDPVCVEPILVEGDWGTMYLAEEGGLIRAVAPLFDCHWDFLGTVDPEGWFMVEAPVVCDGVCAHTLSGQVTGEMVFAVYTTVVDQCTYEYQFSGQRLPDEYDYPTE